MRYALLQGDALVQLAGLDDNSVQSCITSPPYYGLRDYKSVAQIGIEATPQEYVARLVAVFEEVKRVLRPDGTLWLNLGDTYNTTPAGNTTWGDGVGSNKHYQGEQIHQVARKKGSGGLKLKDIMGIPWRVAFALQDAGWILRSDIIWQKPNPMPESVKDRPTRAHEYIFLLTKNAHYFYDADAIAEVSVTPNAFNGGSRGKSISNGDRHDNGRAGIEGDGMRNARDVWTFSTQSYEGAHFATFPEELPERCILAGTSTHGCCALCGAPYERVVEVAERERHASEAQTVGSGRGSMADRSKHAIQPSRVTVGWQATCQCNAAVMPCTVLDPFAGSGTTLAVAMRLGRNGIGVELNPAYVGLAHNRILSTQPALFPF